MTIPLLHNSPAIPPVTGAEAAPHLYTPGICASCQKCSATPNRRPQPGPTGPILPHTALAAIKKLADCRRLTKRETEVLALVCAGLKNAAIAFELRVSVPAVRRHLCSLHRKTNTADKIDLVLNLWHASNYHDDQNR